MLTPDELQTIMPRLPSARGAELFPPLAAAMTEFAIDAPARAAAFLAQLAHESGQLRFMEEIWGPTAAQLRYEPASTLATALGNTEAGDGHRFKGRGPIQITGRANYSRFGNLLGIDLITAPERAALPELAFRIAGLFWSKKGLNELADQATQDAFREITRRINGGFNGLADRQQFYATACAALGVTEPTATRGAPPLDRSLPRAAEPIFERGHEAIRAIVAQRRARKAAPGTRKQARSGTRKPARSGRKAAPASRKPSRRSLKASPATRKKRRPKR